MSNNETGFADCNFLPSMLVAAGPGELVQDGANPPATASMVRNYHQSRPGSLGIQETGRLASLQGGQVRAAQSYPPPQISLSCRREPLLAGTMLESLSSGRLQLSPVERIGQVCRGQNTR